MALRIVTNCIFPPIPDRSNDWLAVDDATYDGTGPVGLGPTEEAAVHDLLGLLDVTHDVIRMMSAAKTAAEWRAMATGNNVFTDETYHEIADEIESDFVRGEYI